MLFLAFLSQFLYKLKLALAISTGAPITDPNVAIEMVPLFADKKIRDLSKQPKEAINY